MINKPNFPVIDGHIDTVTKLQKEHRKFSSHSENGHCDLPRMIAGNIKAAVFAIYPASTQQQILNGLDLWFKLVSNPINGLMQVKTIEDFERAHAANKKGAILHLEGAGGIDTKFRLLRIGYQLGLRTMSLSWANVNKYATGAFFKNPQKKTGLTDKGKDLIAEIQSLGITIDVSHLNELSFWDIVDISVKPIIASHSNARTITDISRNLTDEQIKAIQAKNGTIGINFGKYFLKPKNSIEEKPDLNFEDIKRHIDHIVNVADINTLAIGSDFDGTTMPECVKDCTTFPALWNYLLENGYNELDINKISHLNLLRVFKQTWK